MIMKARPQKQFLIYQKIENELWYYTDKSFLKTRGPFKSRAEAEYARWFEARGVEVKY